MYPSAEAQHGTYQVAFQNLIQLLTENLYSTPKAAVRELIQNASDSCWRRRSQEGAGFSAPAINLVTDARARTVTIVDNGAGMVKDEVIQYLATIGATGTGEARRRLMASDETSAEMLIGQFGVGFLSAFVIAEHVLVETTPLHGEMAVR